MWRYRLSNACKLFPTRSWKNARALAGWQEEKLNEKVEMRAVYDDFFLLSNVIVIISFGFYEYFCIFTYK